MKFATYAERRDVELREKSRRRHMRKRMKKMKLNPDSKTDQLSYLLRSMYKPYKPFAG